ncbi:MAG: CHAT domain-containing protein [Thermodesulfobacteriota bacterium]
MNDYEQIGPLLDAFAEDDDPGRRRLLIEALVALDLPPAVWRESARLVTPAALAMIDSEPLDGETAALLARLPLFSVRQRLRRIAADQARGDALLVAVALADVQDIAVLPTLVRQLARSPDEEVARALAALPLEAAAVSERDLAPGLAAENGADEGTRMWTAIALARFGDLEPLEQLWDALVRPPEFWAQSTRPALFREPPPLFEGDPSLTVARLAGVGPLPARLVRFLIGLRDNDYDADWNPRHPELVGPSRNPILLVAGLTATCDQDGNAVVAAPPTPPWQDRVQTVQDAARAVKVVQRLAAEPWRGLKPAIDDEELPLLAKAPGDLSAEVLENGVRQLAAQAVSYSQAPRHLLGNALLGLATALPAPLPLRIASVLLNPEIDRLPADALSWILGRAGAVTAVRALTPLIAGSIGGERTRWLSWLARIAAQAKAPAPFAGAGGKLAAPPRNVEMVDDTIGHRRLHAGLVGAGAGTRPPGQAVAAAATAPAGSGPGAPSPPRLAYPDIAADDANPVAGATVHFVVQLAELPATATIGEVELPDSPPEVEHTLRVHLLFGAASAWDSLTWSAARGTIEAAKFSLPAPAVGGERALVEVRANFYLQQRWCGEGLRTIDVRRDASVAPLAEIPLPTLPPWRGGLLLEPGATPPDFIVRIQKGEVPGDFTWSCLSPHLDFPAPANEGDDRMALQEDAATFIRKTFAPLANRPLARLKLADVEGAGEKIYRCTPPYFRDCYWSLWHAAAAGGFAFESVQIVTDEPCVPWELMRMVDRDRAPGVAPELFAIRHCVGRWLATESAQMRQRIAVGRIAVAASSYESIPAVGAKLPWAASEQQLMIDSYHADTVPLTSDALLDFLEGGAAQAVHLACHGRMSITDPDASVLVMEDTPNDLTPLSIARSEVCDGLGSQHPLVFLNACEVGAAAASMSLVAGFPAAFLYSGASALVSPLWTVNDERARRIAEDFYREVLIAGGGKPLGAVLRDLRGRWKEEKHLTYLAYVLYGDPMAKVDYRPQ